MNDETDALHDEGYHPRNALVAQVHHKRGTGEEPVDELLSSTLGGDADDSTCLARAAELRTMLLPQ